MVNITRVSKDLPNRILNKMLSIHPDALIWNQSYVFFNQNYDEWGHKIFKLCFQPKNAKKYANFRGFHVTFKRDGSQCKRIHIFIAQFAIFRVFQEVNGS